MMAPPGHVVARHARRRQRADRMARGGEEVHAVAAVAVFEEASSTPTAQASAADADACAIRTPARVDFHEIDAQPSFAHLDRGRHAGEPPPMTRMR
jgi:hypothetical protein